MTGQEAPNIHPGVRMRTATGELVDIDVELVPLIDAIWTMGLRTTSCCQDFGEGTEGQRNLVQMPSRYGGDAFIAYYRGYAWLKMPVTDGKALLDGLLHTGFRDRIIKRWTPGSWRLHVPVIFEAGEGLDLASDMQIHFPRGQLPELLRALSVVA